jgi:hypothetical protein
MIEPIRCKKNECQIETEAALFGGYYARCQTCNKVAGHAMTKEAALAEWNRWVEIGGFIQVAREAKGE